MDVKLTIPEQIIILQKRRGISREEMASALGISLQGYSRRLRGNSFSSAELEKIADILGCTIEFRSTVE